MRILYLSLFMAVTGAFGSAFAQEEILYAPSYKLVGNWLLQGQGTCEEARRGRIKAGAALIISTHLTDGILPAFLAEDEFFDGQRGGIEGMGCSGPALGGILGTTSTWQCGGEGLNEAVVSKNFDLSSDFKTLKITTVQNNGNQSHETYVSCLNRLFQPNGYCETRDRNFTYDSDLCERVLRSCETRNSRDYCIVDFYWPSGSRTVLETDGGRALRINGNTVPQENSLDNSCTYNSGNRREFCYLYEREMNLKPHQPETEVPDPAGWSAFLDDHGEDPSVKSLVSALANAGGQKGLQRLIDLPTSENLVALGSIFSVAAYLPSGPAQSLFQKLGFDILVNNLEDVNEDGDFLALHAQDATGRDVVIVAVTGSEGAMFGLGQSIDWIQNFDWRTRNPPPVVLGGMRINLRGQIVASVQSKAETIFKTLITKLKSRAIDPVRARFVVTGHSQGGMVAGVLAAQLAEAFGEQRKPDSIRLVTFASPGSGDGGFSGYYGYLIGGLNVIHPIDPVPKAGRAVGLSRVGIDVELEETLFTFDGLKYHNMAETYLQYVMDGKIDVSEFQFPTSSQPTEIVPSGGTEAMNGHCRFSRFFSDGVEEQGTCRKQVLATGHLVFIWASGRVTTVTSRDGTVYGATAIDGGRAGVTNRMGEGGDPDCTLQWEPSKMFCFQANAFGNTVLPQTTQPTDTLDLPQRLSGTTWQKATSSGQGQIIHFENTRMMFEVDPFVMGTYSRGISLEYTIEGGEITFRYGTILHAVCRVELTTAELTLRGCRYDGVYRPKKI